VGIFAAQAPVGPDGEGEIRVQIAAMLTTVGSDPNPPRYRDARRDEHHPARSVTLST